MPLLDNLIAKAPESDLARWCLSTALRFVVPFNNPHRLTISEFAAGIAKVKIPFCRSNKNHLGTVHACVMAAAGEYVAGLAIISLVSPSKYRVIIRDLHVAYLLQGREELSATCSIASQLAILQTTPPTAELPLELHTNSEVRDSLGQLCATVDVIWQIKPRH